jgi:serine/threonine-protein kinase
MNAIEQLGQMREALADRYAVGRVLGAGGMATVYEAEDIRHRRPVAIKILKPELGAALGAERFLREIQITARLQHPHILPLHDSGEYGGCLYYIMPLVEGESLRDRLTRERQLPVEHAVHVAEHVASALDYAHRHGVVHRDLKPENILLQDGNALVADFGIARAITRAAEGDSLTGTGITLGTPQYMSPEQIAAERELDARTDVYSLGCVLYEMLVGAPPFTAPTAQAVFAKVMTEQPRPIGELRRSVPPYIAAAVHRALEKVPADRFATALEFLDALRGPRQATAPTDAVARDVMPVERAPVGARRRLPWQRVLPWVVAGAATIAALMLWRRPSPPAKTVRFELADESARIRSANGLTISLSPDGTRMVIAGGPESSGQLFLRNLADLKPIPMRGTDRALTPVFSPDGRSVLFIADGRLRRIDLGGGTPVTISDSGGPATWMNDGIVFTRGTAIYSVSPNGGPVRRVAEAQATPGITGFAWPSPLPSGKEILVSIRHSFGLTKATIGVIRLSDGAVTDLKVEGLNPRYLPTGHLIFGRADLTVYGMAFDAKRLRLSGPAVPLIEDVVVKNGGATEVAVAGDGTMAYRSGSFARKLVLVDRRGVPTPLLSEPRDYSFPSISPDGKRIAVTIGATTSTSDTWIFDTQTGALTRLTRGRGERPEWTPDGKTVLTVLQDSVPHVMSQPWDGSGGATIYASAPQPIMEISLPRRGIGYMAARVGAGGPRDIWIAPVDSPAALHPFVATEADEFAPTVSPDGTLLAYISNESGRYEVYVRTMTGAPTRVQISTTGAIEPLWSPTGRELLYRADKKVIAARITWQGGTARVEREALFDDIYGSSGNAHVTYGVMPDGKHFVFGQSTGSDPKTIVTLNWFDEVRRRMSATGNQ